jgi:cytochrome c oxidase cbb3-type subunit 3
MSMRQIGIVATILLLNACSRSEGGNTVLAPAAGLPSEESIAAVPLGHVPGLTDSSSLAQTIANPYERDPQAVAAGHALYIQMNCAGCHAYNAKGNMGPDLTDTYWRYGGLPVDIYRSIHDGRPQGMPAWGTALPPQEIWKLVAFIESLGGTFPAIKPSAAANTTKTGAPTP